MFFCSFCFFFLFLFPRLKIASITNRATAEIHRAIRNAPPFIGFFYQLTLFVQAATAMRED